MDGKRAACREVLKGVPLLLGALVWIGMFLGASMVTVTVFMAAAYFVSIFRPYDMTDPKDRDGVIRMARLGVRARNLHGAHWARVPDGWLLIEHAHQRETT